MFAVNIVISNPFALCLADALLQHIFVVVTILSLLLGFKFIKLKPCYELIYVA